MNFINLNVRSCYSLLGSTIDIDSLIEYAKERKLDTLSLVEDGSMHSAVKFFTACVKSGIRPVIGVNLIVETKNSINRWTLFARNQTGYRVLLKLSSDYALYNKVVAKDILAHADHLVICVDVDGVKDAFEFNVQAQIYLGISSIKSLQRAKSLQKMNLEFVFLNEVCVLNEEDIPVLKVLASIKNNTKVSQVKMAGDRHFLSTRDARLMGEQDAFLATAMENTVKVADLCHLELNLGRNWLPKFEVASKDLAIDYLEALCIRGAKRRYGELLPRHYDRLKYELNVIGRMGFADYFLIVWDFVKYAKMNGILVGPGRGSAAGSLVAYVLGITGVDPIKYDLLFERFLNPERISLPDIDIDFQDDRRDEVIDYVKEKYGDFAVCQIATFGTFATRSSWRDTARVHGLETAQINAVTRYLKSGNTLAKNLEDNPNLQGYLESHPSQKAVYMKAMRIEGLPKHVSTHAAGVIISPADLRNFTAIKKGATDVYLSQYEAGDLEAIGLLKMDFLGLRNLTMIQEISAMIRAESGASFDIDHIPLDDKLTYKLIASGNTTGIFQLESGGMRAALRKILPSNIEDIISALALFRPGPMANIPMFVARKHGREPIIYDHPTLEPILSNTYGVIVYQEQIMQIAHQVAGYSLGESDILRRAISKKDKRVMQEEGFKFIQRAKTRGYDCDIAKKIFDLILKFADYGFNRSHAASYGMISYQMAYLKANYPHYFMASVMTTVMGNSKETAAAVKEARGLGIEVLAPSVNSSHKGYSIENGKIRLGFLSIKYIGLEMANKLIAERSDGKFLSFFDFITRTSKFLGEKVLAALIDVGACDEFGYPRTTLHLNVSRILDFEKYDGGLFGTTFEMEQTNLKQQTHLEMMEREYELLGFYLQTHPIHLFEHQIRDNCWMTPSTLLTDKGSQVLCIGFVSRIREIRDKNGNIMAFLELSDEMTQIDVTIFSREYSSKYKSLAGKVIVIQGSVSIRNERISLALKQLISILM